MNLEIMFNKKINKKLIKNQELSIYYYIMCIINFSQLFVTEFFIEK